jgi:hypothetical protein
MRFRLLRATTAALLVAGLMAASSAAAKTYQPVSRGLLSAVPPPGYTVVGGTAHSLASGGTLAVRVACPAGTVPVGGGAVNDSSSTLVDLTGSYPVAKTHSWVSRAYNGSVAPAPFAAFAICMTKPAKYKIVKAVTTSIAPLTGAGIFGAACPTGTVVLGGGVKDGSDRYEAIESSYPSPGSPNNYWYIVENNRDPLHSHPATSYSVCGKAPVGYQLVESSLLDNPPGTQSLGVAACPTGVALSGGAYSDAPDLYVDINTSWPETGGWTAYMNNATSTDYQFYTWAVCAGT